MSPILAPSGRPARLEIKARYEGAQHTRARSWISWGRMSSDKDLRGAGSTLSEKSRYLYKNSPIIRGLIERIVTLVVGTGIFPIPASSDERWNQLAKGVTRQRTRHVELATGAPWGEVVRMILRAMLLDGELFGNKVTDEYGMRRLQLIESHYCPFGQNAETGATDGLTLDQFQRPTQYWFKSDDLNAKVEPVAGDNIIHFISRIRANQHRGEPVLAAAINTAHDIDDILALEKQAVKGHSAIRDIITTRSGELDAEDVVVGGNVQTDTEEQIRYYRNIFGPEAKVLQRGDDWKPFVSDRPSSAWSGFMEFLANTVCVSANFPPSVVLPVKAGSNDNRRDVALAQRSVEQWQSILIPRLSRAWEHLVSNDVEDGALSGAPADWQMLEWQKPRNVTLDSGRDANADREDYLVGLNTRRTLFAEWSQDWKEEERQTAVETQSLIQQAKRIAKEEGIDFAIALNLMSRRDANSMSAASGAQQPVNQGATNG